MNDFLKKVNSYFSVKNVSYASLALNISSIVLGIVFLIIPIYSLLWDIFGIILFITLFGNFLLVYLNSIKLNKTTKFGNRLNWLCYYYPITVIFSVLYLILGNLLISMTYSSQLIAYIGPFVLMIIGFFGIFIVGGIIAYLDIKNLEKREVWDLTIKGDYSQSKRTQHKRMILKVILGVISILILVVGAYFATIMLNPTSSSLSFIINAAIPQFAVGLSFIFFSTSILLIKILNRENWQKFLHYGTAIAGVIITIIFLLPLFFVPYSINLMESNFSTAFGINWRNGISSEVDQQYFRQNYFSIPEHFLGNYPKDCKVDAQVEFYNGEGVRLHYDAYYLEGGGADLPGKNSIIVKIHGGSWRYGDKGAMNMLQVNKFLASQGYVVFDIQYGLKEEAGGYIPTPDYVLGDFDIEDQIRHIGIFTKRMIGEYAAQYGGDLNSVFITGNSAGGHLACTTALAIDSKNYDSIFGSGITIKGMLPIYPANGHSGLDGRDEFQNPENYFITSNTFPCFIFQGMLDLGCSKVSQDIKDKYTEAGNDRCAILWLPFAGHATDLYYSGHFNLVYMYYLERFLYLCVNDLI